MDAVLHRIEALPGDGRYAVTFARGDGSEQTAVAEVTGADDVLVAEAGLPAGWTRDSELFRGTASAVLALDAARRLAPAKATLRDVDGGWDVGLGNVVLGADGVPHCTADGPMQADTAAGARWTCATCGAQAEIINR